MYKKTILDRVQRCVLRDKNRPCVLIWSMGNESGYGVGFIEAGQWVKENDPTRLLHYESSIHTGGKDMDVLLHRPVQPHVPAGRLLQGILRGNRYTYS